MSIYDTMFHCSKNYPLPCPFIPIKVAMRAERDQVEFRRSHEAELKAKAEVCPQALHNQIGVFVLLGICLTPFISTHVG